MSLNSKIVEVIYFVRRKYRGVYRFFLIPYWKEHFKKFGTDVWIGRNCSFIYSHVEIGNDVQIGDGASFIASKANIRIGNKVIFGPNVTIRGGDHPTNVIGRYMKDIKECEKDPQLDQDVIIEDDVWIGCNVTILKGVHIGRGSVVGAGSVVTRSILPYTIYVGSHQPFYKPRFSSEEIIEHERLLNKIAE